MIKHSRRFLALFMCIAVFCAGFVPANAAEQTNVSNAHIQNAIVDILVSLDEISNSESVTDGSAEKAHDSIIENINKKRHRTAGDNDAVVSEEAYISADKLFAQLDNLEARQTRNNKSTTAIVDAAQKLVLNSEYYEEGTMFRNGDSFTWWTTDGIRCVYSPRMRKIRNEMEAPADGLADGAYNEPRTVKNNHPSGKDVYLIGPYYGHDDSFTDQYQIEAERIAEAIGDHDGYTLYSGTGATVDRVAEAISKGAVVIFDSHGDTDYASGDDYVTGATSSYLCLTSTSGLTSADYDDGALYFSDGIYINGATISNHMKSNSPSGILWMAMCLGMATDTICEPMRDRGVEVVYGYSQSVTFYGDYLFEEVFWNEMCSGSDVASAIGNMKKTWGNWDWTPQIADYYNYTDGCSSISAARKEYLAFPIVVSDEDQHPGQRGKNGYGADDLQTVCADYTLFDPSEEKIFGYQVLDGAVFEPIIADYTDAYIELVPIDGYEYSKDGTNWQNSNCFDGLKAKTQYYIYQRQKASGMNPAGVISPAAAVKTALRGTSSQNNYDDLARYINLNGYVDDDGYSYLYDSLNQDDVNCDLYITNYENGIYLQLVATYQSESAEVEIYTEYGIFPESADGEAYSCVSVYSGNYLMDEVWDIISIDRADLNQHSNYSFPYTSGSYVSADQYTSLFNKTLDIMLAAGDISIFGAIGNGLKGLGFISYESDYGYNVCDPLINYHFGKTELRNQRGANCCIPGYSGDVYCSDCGVKLEEGEGIPVGSFHILSNDPDAGCILCGAVGTDADFTGDSLLTDADAIYLLRFTLFPANYPVNKPADFTGDGQVTDADAIYLLRHTLFPEQYPLYSKAR